MRSELGRTLARAVLALSAVLAIGTVGYLVVETGWTPLDAFYMTLITITTIGYGEIRPLDPAGRLFTSALIVLGIGVAATSLAQIGAILVESRVGSLLGRRRMDERIKRMTGHYIVCGFAEIGAAIASELDRARLPFVVVDDDEELLARASTLGFPTVRGALGSDAAFLAAGVARAAGLVIASGDLTTNLVASMAGRELNPALHIIARGEDPAFEERLLRAGADSVAYPLKLGGQRVARLVLEQAGAATDAEAGSAEESILGYRIRLYRLCAAEEGRDAATVAGILERTGALEAVSLRRADGTRIERPDPGLSVSRGDALALLVREGDRPSRTAPGVSWTDEMSVGVPSLDEEHRLLLSLIARIEEASKRKSPRPEIAAIFDRLIEYTEGHFRHEERLFAEYGYADRESHAAEHRALTAQVLELNRDRSSILPDNVAEFLVDWLKVHIMGSDKKYVELFVSRGAK